MWEMEFQIVEFPLYFKFLQEIFGGEGGIRTLGTVARTPHFECGAFDHSATSPRETGRQRGVAVLG